MDIQTGTVMTRDTCDNNTQIYVQHIEKYIYIYIYAYKEQYKGSIWTFELNRSDYDNGSNETKD